VKIVWSCLEAHSTTKLSTCVNWHHGPVIAQKRLLTSKRESVQDLAGLIIRAENKKSARAANDEYRVPSRGHIVPATEKRFCYSNKIIC